ncbi:MAG: dUTP diphosphatase [Bacteriovoracaceae bacterium]|nr:dUTP diphosphatase [Bacteriovoracaceae bacterium]
MQVKIKLLPHFDKELPLPFYATIGSAGADICACLGVGEKIILKPTERIAIPTGLSLEVPVGFEMQVRPRSGLSLKTGLIMPNSPGTIDSDYRGEIKIILGNVGNKDEEIKHGDRIAQLLLSPVVQAQFVVAENLEETQRGAGGFGSTGRNNL